MTILLPNFHWQNNSKIDSIHFNFLWVNFHKERTFFAFFWVLEASERIGKKCPGIMLEAVNQMRPDFLYSIQELSQT